MFSLCSQYLPSSAEEFKSIIHSENSEDLGYTPYTDTPIECVVKNGYVVKMAE